MSMIEDDERRVHQRIPANLLPALSARLSGGDPVRLLDVSRRGVRLETTSHMRPGQTVCIRFVAADATVTLTAAVVRATVARLDSGGVRYETALSLAGDLLLCEQLHEEATQPPAATETRATEAPDPAALDQVVDFTVIVNSTMDTPGLLDGMHANSW